jgi:ATP-dependent DNA helicase RecQ
MLRLVVSNPAPVEPSLDDVARARFGVTLRPWQREAVQALLGDPGRVLTVAPTGGGKSLVYQLPATMLPGTTLVLSPLVALMEDQVRGLEARGIKATYLASTLSVEVRREREAALERGEYSLVYAAPERLANEYFVGLLRRLRIPLVAVDEAHCIVQWGHDFRPDYLRIGDFLRQFKPPRVLACTATATPEARTEIRQRLGLEDRCHEIVRGFARPNLHLEAATVEGRSETERFVTNALRRRLANGGGAIVYVATRKGAEMWTEKLTAARWKTLTYHAGMQPKDRSVVSEAFAAQKVDVVVATNAFGMGIDRPDIRLVVHAQPPASIEAYYQEVGRAGRDGQEAHGMLLCSSGDIALRRRLIDEGSAQMIARQWGLFRELLRYLDARSCRHDFILRYFGDESETLGGCGHCDVCVALESEPPQSVEESTLVVRKALSGVARANRRAGLLAIAEMLRGAQTTKIKKFRFDSLTTYGILKEYDGEAMMALLRALLAAGFIDLTPTNFPVPFVTNVGWEVMKGTRPARIVLPQRVRARPVHAAPAPKAAAPVLDAAGSALLEKLKAHRATVAKSIGMPAYVVAHDRALYDLVARRPKTIEELLKCHGFGPLRAEQYGEGFLRVLSEP